MTTRATASGTTPIGEGSRLAPAGKEWDAIRVTRIVGLQAIRSLGARTGPVIMDPAARVMYFLVPPGSTSSWEHLPQSTALSETNHVVLPPKHKHTPPGPYWLIAEQQPLADTHALRRALEEVLQTSPVASPDPRLNLARLTFNQVKGYNCALCGTRLVTDRSLGFHSTDTGVGVHVNVPSLVRMKRDSC
ncbi:hypothetical protein ACTU45_04690 [Streptomyces sp. 24-1644]|uniref:hypothetical protein n=1 Tax=Streptomyces sp. 24-1644 TaxID=3457315 RepID=UPI003FA76900